MGNAICLIDGSQGLQGYDYLKTLSQEEFAKLVKAEHEMEDELYKEFEKVGANVYDICVRIYEKIIRVYMTVKGLSSEDHSKTITVMCDRGFCGENFDFKEATPIEDDKDLFWGIVEHTYIKER